MNREEFNTCVDQHSDKVFRFILRYLPDKDMAKDILQDAFEKMWINHKNIEYKNSKTYLFTTVYHKSINQLRTDRNKSRISDIPPIKISYSEEYSDLKNILDKALNQLPEIQKTVVLLKDYGGYKYEEIAEIEGITCSQVKILIFRARTTLKEYLIKMDIGDFISTKKMSYN